MIETQEQYNNAVETYLNLFGRSISEGITLDEKTRLDELERNIRKSKFFK